VESSPTPPCQEHYQRSYEAKFLAHKLPHLETIYEEDYEFSEDSITLQEDGSFLMRGDADLSDVDTILSLHLSEEDSLKEFAAFSACVRAKSLALETS
jgi:hypothetical protein